MIVFSGSKRRFRIHYFLKGKPPERNRLFVKTVERIQMYVYETTLFSSKTVFFFNIISYTTRNQQNINILQYYD